MEISATFQLWISNLNQLWSENILCMVSLLNVLRLFYGPGHGLSCYMFCEHFGKSVYSAVNEWKVLWISLRICWWNSSTSLLTLLSSYCWDGGVEVFSCHCGFVSFLSVSIHFCLTCFPSLLFGASTFKAVILGGLTFCHYIVLLSVVVFFVLKSALSNIHIAVPTFLWLMFADHVSSWLGNYLKWIFVDLM